MLIVVSIVFSNTVANFVKDFLQTFSSFDFSYKSEWHIMSLVSSIIWIGVLLLYSRQYIFYINSLFSIYSVYPGSR